MSRFLLWVFLPVGLIFFLGTEAINRPIVKVGMDNQCLSVVMIKDDQEVEVGCDTIDLKEDRYNIQQVFSPVEIEEIEKALART